MAGARHVRKVASWVLAGLAGALWVARAGPSAAGSGPMTSLARAVRAARRDGVVFGTTLAEAQVETRLRSRGSGMLARLADESLEALSEKPGRPEVRRYAAMTEVTATGSGGATAAVEGNAAAFERSIWMSVRSGPVPVESVAGRSEFLAEALQGVTGENAEPVAAAEGLCRAPCRHLDPQGLAAELSRASGVTLVERVSGPAMAVVLGYGSGEPATDMAGRTVNLEVVVTRTAQGLVAQIGAPFVPPVWSTLRSV